jgi:DNA-binding transcriptional MerR regulator
VDEGTLRHDNELGLSERVRVGADTGYERCATERIVMSQIIHRLRDLDMPLEDIRAVLEAPDVETRNRVIATHLGRLESNLARTHEAARALRDLLDGQRTSPEIAHRNTSAASPKGEASDAF